MRRTVTATLNGHIVLRSKWHRRQKECTLTTYCKVVNNLSEMYATDNVVAETNAYMMHFPQP